MAVHAPSNSAPTRSTLRRVLAAQESGLILVIVVLGCILTILCRVPVEDRRDIAANATIVSVNGIITVTDGAQSETYNDPSGPNGSGWTFHDEGDTQFVVRTTIFNRFLSRGNLVGIAKDAPSSP